MQLVQTRRGFLGSASLAAAAGVLGVADLSRTRAARNDHDPAR